MDAAERNRRALNTDHLKADLGQRTARGGVTAMAAQVTRILVQLGVAAALARLLAPQDFGLVAMATTLMLFVGLFTDLGLSSATIQRKEIDQATVSALFYVNLAAGLMLALVCAAAAPIAAWMFGDSRVLPVAIVLGLSIPISAAGSQHGALLQRGMRWMEMQWTPPLSQFVGGGLAVLLAWKGGIGYWALVVQILVNAIVSTALLWGFCPWRPDIIPQWRRAGAALRFGLPLTGFSFLDYFRRQFDNVLIGWRWGAADLGYYTRAYTLLTLPLALVSTPMASAVIPALSHLQDDAERWRGAFLRAFGALNLVSAGLTAMLIASAEPLVRFIYGPGWTEAGHIFLLLAISMFAATPMNATIWIYVSLGQTQRLLRWSLIVTPFYVAAFFVGLPFGATGVALCYSIAASVATLPCLAYATKNSPVSLWQVLPTVVPPAVLGAAVIALEMLVHWTPESHFALVRVIEASSVTGALYLAGAVPLLLFSKSWSPLRDQLREMLRKLTRPETGKSDPDSHR